MKIKDIALSAAYVGQRVVKAICVGAQEVWSAVKYIVFKDPVVEQICVTNWGDGVGITEEQAAAVTGIGTVFKDNKEITSFDEFEKFVNVKSFIVTGYTFYGCSNLESITIPEGITDMGVATFWNCKNLKSVKFPKKITRYGEYCFAGCTNLTYAPFPEGLEYVAGFNESGLTGHIILPKSVKAIGSFANTKITHIEIPDSITTINGPNFNSCSQLASVKFPNNLTGIGSAAFQYCALEHVDIPSTVTEIADYAFFYGIKGDTIIVRAITPPSAGAQIFQNFKGLIYVPDQSVQAYREASGWLDYADKIWPMEGYLYGLVKFADPAVEAICVANWDTNGTGFLNKEDAKAVTSLGAVFYGNTEITSFEELGEFTSVINIPNNCFKNCTSLASIDVSNIQEIGSYAFSGCESLTNINLGESVKKIESAAFSGCSSLVIEELNAPNLEELSADSTFGGVKVINIVNLGRVTTIGGFSSHSELKSVILNEGLLELGWGAFRYCSSLSSITLPSTITKLNNYCLEGCWALKSVKCLATTPPELGSEVFTTVTIIYVPDASVDAYKAKEGWSTYADRIKPLSEYVEA